MSPEDDPQNDQGLSLDSISSAAVEKVPEEPDAETALEEGSVDDARGLAELQSFIQDTGERKAHAKKIFYLTCAWVTGIYVLLLLDGFGWWRFHLPDPIMLAAIGSTTANIIGVFLIVARYFFPKKNS